MALGSDLMSATEQDLDNVGIGSGELSPIAELSSDMQQSGYISFTRIPLIRRTPVAQKTPSKSDQIAIYTSTNTKSQIKKLITS